MHPELTPAAWALIGALGFAPIGALFGAIAGALARTGGHVPGGPAARAAVRAATRLKDRELSATAAGAIGGAADGALFVGILGAAAGLFAGFNSGGPDLGILFVAVGGLALLVGMAVVFGVLGHWLSHQGSRGIALLFLTCAGGVVGHSLALAPGAFLGGVIGAGIGLLGWVFPERTSEREPPPARPQRQLPGNSAVSDSEI